ncbi:MAG: CapA family protein [Halobacteria archaeon]|nr:CapA family protein [Halobacteria archaeon]
MDVSRRHFLATSTLVLSGCLDLNIGAEEGGDKNPLGGNESEECPEDGDSGEGPRDDGRVILGFTGDVMMGRSVNEYWSSKPKSRVSSVWDGMLPHLNGLDGAFVNLECCISKRGEKWPDRTYYFRANPDWSVPALKKGNVRWTSLANNHLMDFGEVALKDTLKHLSDADIAHSGAGRNLEEAREPAFVSVEGVHLAMISFTDHPSEYGAKEDRPGTSYISMDIQDRRTREAVLSTLEKADEKNPDLIVASLHWGPNWVVKPARKYIEFAHWLVDQGVDLVHGHSAHVFQGIEIYKGKPILHDTGDFLDDYIVKPDLHNNRSFLFKAVVDPDESRVDELRLYPIVIDDLAVHEADGKAAEWSRSRMRELSSAFGTTLYKDGRELVVRVPEC